MPLTNPILHLYCASRQENIVQAPETITAIQLGPDASVSLTDRREGGIVLAHVDRGQVFTPLVAEDNVVNQKVAVRMLEKLGYRADVAANGQEALEALARIPYAAVLMDGHMPEMDGFEATAALRQREGRDRHTPIIAMTASAMAGDREQCLAAGMDDYLTKPVSAEQLQAVLERWIPRATSGDDAAREPSAVPEPDASVDRTVLANVRGLGDQGGLASLGELIDGFLGGAPVHLASLRAAATAGDADTLVRV